VESSDRRGRRKIAKIIKKISQRINADRRGLGIEVKSQDLTTARKRRKQFAFGGNGNQRSYLPVNRQAGY
jgi:hypothetical protein